MEPSGGAVMSAAGDESFQNLPDDLLEKIIARVPFPSIFKARCLSKFWLARLSPISSRDDLTKQRLVASFQRQVGEQSRNWESCGPVMAFGDDDLTYVGYNRSSNSWRRLPSLSFLDNDLLSGSPWLTGNLHIEGALLYVYMHRDLGYVANMLTKRWKRLPPCPNSDRFALSSRLVTDASSETYKVVLFCQLRIGDEKEDPYSVEVYDSKSDSWSCRKILTSRSVWGLRTRVSNSAYFDGVVYLLVEGTHPEVLWTYNVEKDTFKELPLRNPLIGYRSKCLVVCDGGLLLVFNNGDVCCNVWRVDLESLTLHPHAEWRCLFPDAKPFLQDEQPVCDGDCIYLGIEGRGMLAYDLDEAECRFVGAPLPMTREYSRWIATSFRPGLCPFAAV